MKRWLWVSLIMLTAGCATQNGGFSERDKVMFQTRIDDLETAQTRQKSKILALETRINQLEDTLSMLARRNSDIREVVRIEPDNQASVSADFDRREIVAIAPEEEYQDIIIGEDKKRAYFGTPQKNSGSSGYVMPASLRQPYENVVTNDKLPSNANTTTNAGSTPAASSPMVFYQEGIDLYRQGNFDGARAKFDQFLATKPDASYVDNALYWIGECFYGQGLYHEAATYFHRVIQEYPNENKVPDALLKVSLTYQKLGKLDSAREMLKYLIDAFPGTEAARVGKEKYQSLAQP